jgi:2'-hydroxyisoflavone reductase
LPKAAEQLLGDRNGKLDALKGRKWDVVIDNPTTLPVWVRDAAEILKGNVDRYVFISTISVYADTSKLGMDESAPLAKYTGTDAMKETSATMRASNFALYGPLKALSEAEAEKSFPGKTLIIRPGYIVGPGDESDRFTYWPVRVERGGEVLAPGTPADPIQIIDARDLAEWTIRMVEQGATGSFNAVGPKSKLAMGRMLDVIKSTTNSDARFTWVEDKFLTSEKIIDDIPIWTSTHGPEIGYSTMNINKAVSHGLTFRPLADTTRATLDWFTADLATAENARWNKAGTRSASIGRLACQQEIGSSAASPDLVWYSALTLLWDAGVEEFPFVHRRRSRRSKVRPLRQQDRRPFENVAGDRRGVRPF